MNFSSFFPKDKREAKIFGAVLLLFCFGIVTSAAYGDWGYLERSGSLIVIVALSLFWKEHIKQRQELIERLIATEEHYKKNSKSIAAFDDLEGRDIVVYFNVDKEKARDSIESARKRYENIEVSIAIFGTLLWGYANPIFSLFFELQ